MALLRKKNRVSRLLRDGLALVLLVVLAVAMPACNKGIEEPGSYSAASDVDCLPDISLTDQHGSSVSLASLKGKPVLFDFFYTTCPGPCLMLTARMRRIANELGPALGNKAWLVSVTVDPEHDHVQQLADYTKEQGVADNRGWLFLTGTPQQIDAVMARFKLRRQRESDGSVDHVLEFFLVGPDGHQMIQYMASETNPAKIAGDVEQAASGGGLLGSAGVDWHG
ncbi:MAG TPA: SCO family protein [Candidatus Binataceae bacterium]|nr:SCO family protein [Candidatus Binataceae bacterium]